MIILWTRVFFVVQNNTAAIVTCTAILIGYFFKCVNGNKNANREK